MSPALKDFLRAAFWNEVIEYKWKIYPNLGLDPIPFHFFEIMRSVQIESDRQTVSIASVEYWDLV